jgi:hypothetical protein
MGSPVVGSSNGGARFVFHSGPSQDGSRWTFIVKVALECCSWAMILAASTMCCVSCEDWSWSWVWARVASNEFGAASCSFQIYQGLLCKVGDVLCFLLMQAPSFKKKL